MKLKKHFKLIGLLIPIFALFLSVSLSNCKGKAVIHEIKDSIINCSAPYVVHFSADAEHRSRKLEYTWDFGDGTTSHERTPVHVYNESNVYQVSLSIKQNKAFDSQTKSINLTPDATKPYSDWDFAIAAGELWAPARVEFQNYSKFSTKFIWDFGDGNISSAQDPVHIFENEGTYRTLLSAICEGDTSKYSVDLIIKDSPSNILINEVSVRLPENILGHDIELEIWYNNNQDYRYRIREVSSFPVVFNVKKKLFRFNGDFNRDRLEFIVFVDNDDVPYVNFYKESRDFQLDYYPSLITFDDGYGRDIKAQIGYQD